MGTTWTVFATCSSFFVAEIGGWKNPSWQKGTIQTHRQASRDRESKCKKQVVHDISGKISVNEESEHCGGTSNSSINPMQEFASIFSMAIKSAFAKSQHAPGVPPNSQQNGGAQEDERESEEDNNNEKNVEEDDKVNAYDKMIENRLGNQETGPGNF